MKELTEALEESEDALVLSLGIAKQYEGAPPGMRYSMDYRALGERTYEALRRRLAETLCSDANGLAPWAAIAADGDARDLAVAVFTLVSAHFGMAAAVAVPFAALIAKRGLAGLCDEPHRAVSKAKQDKPTGRTKARKRPPK